MTALCIILGLVLAGASVGETTVRAPRPATQPATPDDVVVDDVVDAEGALLGLPGVALARDGGPLASSRPLVRGLGGARLQVDIAGVNFLDPAAGVVDVALLPLGLGRVALIPSSLRNAGGLSLRVDGPSVVAIDVGALDTLAARARVGVAHELGRATFLVDAGTTNGAFAFTATDSLGNAGAVSVRRNNDQRRFKSAVVVDASTAAAGLPGQWQAHLVSAVSLHEGGVPGFLTAPFADLRAQTSQGVVGGELAHVQPELRVRVFGDVAGSDRQTSSALLDVTSRLTGVSTHGGAGLGTTIASTEMFRLDLDTTAQATSSTIADVVTRTDVAVNAATRGRWFLRRDLQLLLQAVGELRAVDDAPLRSTVDDTDALSLVSGGLSLTAEQRHRTTTSSVFISLSRRTRAPTLDERFAPRGFVGGTANLQPERFSDLEVGGAVDVGTAVSVCVAGYASLLDDAIVYVNKNAFEVAPLNTGAAQRAGLDLGVRLQPLELVRVDVAGGVLASHVDVTAAPLPTAPPLSLRTALRLGDEQGHFTAVVVGRGSAPANIFGTLPSGAYALLNLGLRIPLGERLALHLSVDNVLDVTTARDTNLLPLPGRLAFVGLEVRP
jgi:hypothetical protein